MRNDQVLPHTYGNSAFNVVNYLNTQRLEPAWPGGKHQAADFLQIDDRTMAGPPNNPSSVEIYPNQVKRFFSTQPANPHLIDYDGWESPTYYGNTANSNNIKIFGVSAQVPGAYQYTIFGGTAPDTVTLFPHDASGNLTMNANLGIVGDAGYDTITFDDTTGTTGINYVFNNPFGSGQTNVSGMGLRGMAYGNDSRTRRFAAARGTTTSASIHISARHVSPSSPGKAAIRSTIRRHRRTSRRPFAIATSSASMGKAEATA